MPMANRARRSTLRSSRVQSRQTQFGGRDPVAIAAVETLEERRMLAYSMKHEPYLQLGNAPLVGTNLYRNRDQIEVIWQTTGTKHDVADPNLDDRFELKISRRDADDWKTHGSAAVSSVPALGPGAADRINHSLVIKGLNWNTEYDYEVTHFRNGAVIGQPYKGRFRTRPKPGDSKPFSFTAYGDSANSSNGAFQSVVDAIAKSNTEFTVLLGDNAYESGTHDELDRRLDPTQAGAAVAGYIRNHVDYFGFGNHDVFTGGSYDGDADDHHGAPARSNYSLPVPENDPAAQTSHFDKPAGTDDETNYSFDYGNVHLATFESNHCSNQSAAANFDGGACYPNSQATLEAELAWILNDLKASDAKWKIVYMHHPVVTVSQHTALNNSNYSRRVIEELKEAGADLVLTGHAHNYQRSFPLSLDGSLNLVAATGQTDNNYPADASAGLVHIVAGMGGRTLDTNGVTASYLAANFPNASAPAAFGYLKVDVTNDDLLVSYVAVDGRILDQFSIGADKRGPIAKLTNLSDNGAGDLDPAWGTLLVNSAPGSGNFQFNVDDVIGHSHPGSVNSASVIVKKDGSVVSATVSYDTGTHVVTVTPAGGITNGTYEVLLSTGATKINDGAGNAMAPTTFTIVVDTAAGASTSIPLVRGSTWRYLDDGSNQGTAWRATAFNDTSWSQGAGPLGYSEPGLGTTVGFGPNSAAKYITTYFRRAFNVTDIGSITSAVIKVRRDDGFVAWLNNSLAASANITNPASVTYTQGANATVGEDANYYEYSINVALLAEGNNVFAVEAHQVNGGSSDLAFDLELEITRGANATVTAAGGGGVNIVVNGTLAGETLTLASNGSNQVTFNTAVLMFGGSPVAAADVRTITVNGSYGDDTLDVSGVGAAFTGLTAAVTVSGGRGDDTLVASPKADSLVGGAGNDTYRYLATGTGTDTIGGEAAGVDTDRLDFAAISQAFNINLANGSAQTVTTGISLVLGNSTAIEDLFTSGSATVLNDTVYGNDRPNLISTGAGNDTVQAGSGSDSVLGGAGADHLYGNYGNDTLHGQVGADYLIGEGDNDFITGGEDVDNAYGDFASSSYGYGYGHYDDIVFGGKGNDVLRGDTPWYGYGGGDDYLDGEEGDDTLEGDTSSDSYGYGYGNDTLEGGPGTDSLRGEWGDDVYQWAGTWLGLDHVQEYGGSVGYGYGGQDELDFSAFDDAVTNLSLNTSSNQVIATGTTVHLAYYQNIEHVRGSAQADSVTGNDYANRLVGGNANDTLNGGANTDTLEGNAGDDSLIGGTGNDTFFYRGRLNLGADYIDEANTTEVDTLDFTLLEVAVDVDLLTNTSRETADVILYLQFKFTNSIENVRGTALDDTIFGNDRANTFFGNNGKDTLNGREGNDTLFGGNGQDSLVGSGDSGVDWLHGQGDGPLGEEDLFDPGAGDQTVLD